MDALASCTDTPSIPAFNFKWILNFKWIVILQNKLIMQCFETGAEKKAIELTLRFLKSGPTPVFQFSLKHSNVRVIVPLVTKGSVFHLVRRNSISRGFTDLQLGLSPASVIGHWSFQAILWSLNQEMSWN